MIITCRHCSTRFVVDPRVLRPGGRRVKCGKCANQWHEPAPPPEEEEPIVLSPLEPDELSQAPIPNLPGFPREDARRGVARGWVAFGVVIVTLAAVLWFGRERIIVAWTPAAQWYAALGIELEPGVSGPLGEGLEVGEVTARRIEDDDGVPYLVIDGVVVNVTDDVKKVPAMVVVLSDASAQELQQWEFVADRTKLDPGESASFSTRLAEPSDLATVIKIEFTNTDDSR